MKGIDYMIWIILILVLGLLGGYAISKNHQKTNFTITNNEDYMYCSKCGTKINKESAFCNKCGNKIEQTNKYTIKDDTKVQNSTATKQDKEENVSTNKSKTSKIAFIIGVMIIIGIIIGVYFASSDSNNSDNSKMQGDTTSISSSLQGNFSQSSSKAKVKLTGTTLTITYFYTNQSSVYEIRNIKNISNDRADFELYSNGTREYKGVVRWNELTLESKNGDMYMFKKD